MLRLLLAASLVVLSTSCGPAVQAPTCTADSYPDDGFTTNAAAELELRARLKALNDAMKAAETSASTTVTAAQLEALYAAGSPSLRGITTPAYQPAVSDVFARFAAASGSTWTPSDPPTGPGGIYGAYLFSARGLDLRQLLDKGLYGGAHYAEAARLMTAAATLAEVDRMLALFGANPSFPMDDKAQVNPDVHTAVYAKRRTNAAAATPGPYLAIKQAFLDARASVAAGDACAQERAQAFATIREQWERALLGTVVYYMTSSAQTLEQAAPTDVQKASALHGIGEAIGFLRGLRALPASQRVISDAQLDEVLATLTATDLDGAQAHRFLTDSASTVMQLSTAISQIQAARQFSAEEINAFKTNY